MSIDEQMKAKMAELETAEAERELLFADFEGNKARIEATYYEVEKLKLEYLLLKREQLSGLKVNENRGIIIESIVSVEVINENCIGFLQKKLKEAGYITA